MPFHISHLLPKCALILALCQACSGPEFRDVPLGAWDPRVYDHNVRECAGQGLVFDASEVRCIEVPK